MKPKVLVTRTIQEKPLALLKEHAEVVVNPHDRSMTLDEIIAELPGKAAMMAMGGDPVNEKLLSAGRDLKIVANNAVGFNNMDVEAATRLKIALSNTPDVLTDTTADLAFAIMMAVARRICEAERYVRAGKWVGWHPNLLLASDIHGKTLGVVGLGRIGAAMAKRALGFNMKIVYNDIRKVESGLVDMLRAQFLSLKDLLANSDFVTLHVPLTPETRHLIGREQLPWMKKTAFLINASRGPVVDEKALVEALQKGQIAGAGLDVFEWEPKVSPELMAMENVVMVPHIGSATFATREAMSLTAAKNIIAALKGETPPNILNPEIYKK
jgi:glyoxylate reductase